MAGATADALLAVSADLLDRSEPLYAELKRLASAAEGASAACRTSLRAGTAALDAFAGASGAGAAAAAEAAAAASADARAASATLAASAARGGAVATQRVAEGEARERDIEADAASFSASLAAQRQALEAAHKEKVRSIMSSHGLAA
jgi:hypothetical protein